ncbi:hypothetical protein [Tunturiibacter gelidiferens]|uniref:hypothetical protein n=1 Tax=Tunturiibacter gelidiferens TaxID=3069689 RepID=UPI003D9AF000
MKVSSVLYDGRIKAHNVLLDFTVGEYLDSVRDVIDRNQYQRKRVSSSKTIYSLLRQDILRGCVIPPIVLALGSIDVKDELFENHHDQILDLIKNNSSRLLILDGLQRTYTLLDLEGEADRFEHQKLRDKQLRVEVYIGIDRLGILYRMLTLNTGQTPMSLRQQIEMLYLDYLDDGLPGVRFVREVSQERATDKLELNFKDTIEGFNSYIDRDEAPLERGDLLENIKSLQNLSHENSSRDLFKEYVLAWVAFLTCVTGLCGESQVSQEDYPENESVWGRTASQVFKKSQAMTGFGAALGKLKDFGLVLELSDVEGLAKKIRLGSGDANDFLLSINKSLAWIKLNTKKIGSAQRAFFFISLGNFSIHRPIHIWI